MGHHDPGNGIRCNAQPSCLTGAAGAVDVADAVTAAGLPFDCVCFCFVFMLFFHETREKSEIHLFCASAVKRLQDQDAQLPQVSLCYRKIISETTSWGDKVDGDGLKEAGSVFIRCSR